MEKGPGGILCLALALLAPIICNGAAFAHDVASSGARSVYRRALASWHRQGLFPIATSYIAREAVGWLLRELGFLPLPFAQAYPGTTAVFINELYAGSLDFAAPVAPGAAEFPFDEVEVIGLEFQGIGKRLRRVPAKSSRFKLRLSIITRDMPAC
jgi:hypothetical protein